MKTFRLTDFSNFTDADLAEVEQQLAEARDVV